MLFHKFTQKLNHKRKFHHHLQFCIKNRQPYRKASCVHRNRLGMAALQLILILLLQFEASLSVQELNLQPGEDATLPCNGKSSSDAACSTVNWLYSRDESQTSVVVENGKVQTQASRLSLGTNCSLVINDISAQDAGRYTCRSTELDIVLNLNIIMPGNTIHLYHRPEDNATLPCRVASLSDRACSTVDWLYNKDESQSFDLVQKGQVVKDSGRAARLSLGTNCSLHINDITAEDAGFYTCDQKYILNTGVLLSVLTITPSLPDADTNTDGNVTLRCTLLSFSKCRSNSIRWVNETGSVLRGEGVGYKVTAQIDCTSLLTVTHLSGPNRTYTCQRIDERNNVQIEDTHYTPFFIDGFSPPKESNTGWSLLDYVMLILRIAGLFLIPLAVVLLLKHRRGNETPPDEKNMHNDGDEVAYENVEAPSAATGQH